jgi:type I restriction enzyme R subunit
VRSFEEFLHQHRDEITALQVLYSQQFSDIKALTEAIAAPPRSWTPEVLIAANLGIEMDDFDYAPFTQKGGAGKVYQVFGKELNGLLDELNEVLAA